MAKMLKVVAGRAKHGWQPYSADNDNGVDGLVIYRKNAVDTGDILFVQVKCGTGKGYYKATQNRPKHFGVNVGEKYIKDHRPRWDSLFGPVILVYVDYDTESAWWTDLKDDASFTQENKSIILVSKSQRFGEHSFGDFKKLKGYIHISPGIQTLEAKSENVDIFPYTSSIKESAKQFYRQWALSSERTHPELGEILVTREGWRHICKKGRRPERIIQSWTLLGVAKLIIRSVTKVYQLRVLESKEDQLGNYDIVDYISLRAQVTFPQRHSSIIQVVLKRKRKFNAANNLIVSKIRFYSVYEPFSEKKIR